MHEAEHFHVTYPIWLIMNLIGLLGASLLAPAGHFAIIHTALLIL